MTTNGEVFFGWQLGVAGASEVLKMCRTMSFVVVLSPSGACFASYLVVLPLVMQLALLPAIPQGVLHGEHPARNLLLAFLIARAVVKVSQSDLPCCAPQPLNNASLDVCLDKYQHSSHGC